MSPHLRLAPVPQPTTDDCDAAIAALDSLLNLEERCPPSAEVTLTIAPEEHQRLLAAAIAVDDDVTIQAPSPVAQMPMAMPAVVPSSESGWRPRLTPEL